MIGLETLKEIGRLKDINNIGYMEKNYIQEILLLIIYRNFNFLIFKGGTCLYKFYKLNRFSEDLDFSSIKKFDLDNFLKVLKNGLRKFDIIVNNISYKKVYNSILIKIKTEGILYNDSLNSLCILRIDINTKSKVFNYSNLNLKPLYPDIPSFDVLVMAKEEILTEKVRAIISRSKARDIYDLWFLLKGGVKINFNLIKQKLDYYNEKFIFDKFKKQINLKREVWERELKPLIPNVPSFKEVKKIILEKFKK